MNIVYICLCCMLCISGNFVILKKPDNKSQTTESIQDLENQIEAKLIVKDNGDADKSNLTVLSTSMDENLNSEELLEVQKDELFSRIVSIQQECLQAVL